MTKLNCLYSKRSCSGAQHRADNFLVTPRFLMIMSGNPYKRIQRKVIKLINDPHFELRLPPLSRDLQRKIDHDDLERDRLEFLGDALMNSFVAQNLYKLLGEGTAHYYSVR